VGIRPSALAFGHKEPDAAIAIVADWVQAPWSPYAFVAHRALLENAVDGVESELASLSMRFMRSIRPFAMA
jgi:hypothetical protein